MSIFGDDLIGYETILRLLESWLPAPASSYLFLGSAHLGKRTVAVRFVKCLLGLEVSDEHWKSHPDLVLLEPEEGKSQISVNQVRDMRGRVSLRPAVAPRVVVYIPSADRLNESGTNALLKVLEEPPAGAVFILVAEDGNKIPETVRSRSVIVPFTQIARAMIVDALVRRGLTSEEATARATESRGRSGLAIEPVDQESTDVGRTLVANLLTSKTSGARLAAIDVASVECESNEEPQIAWREMLDGAMQELRVRFTEAPESAMLIGESLAVAWKFVGSAVPPRMPLEMAALHLSHLSEIDLTKLFPSHLPSALPLIYTL